MHSNGRRLAAELFGTAFLLAVVVGSGIMAQRLSGGNDGIALLANSLATGAGLYALITTLQSIGAHFNPAVTLLAVWRRHDAPAFAALCIAMQFAGAVIGVLAAHTMFGEPLIQVSLHDRSDWPLVFAEFIATAGFLAVIVLASREAIAASVATYITAAYWFTASTSFANPAVTVARAMTASFSGIAWSGVAGFVVAQVIAVVVVALALRRGKKLAV